MAENRIQEHRSTYRKVLAQPTFQTLFTTRVLSITGDAVRALALAILVFNVTHSPLFAAIAYSISFIPQMLGSGLFGALADRLRPRPLLATLYAIDACAGIVIAIGRPPVAVSLLLVAAVALVTPLYQGTSSRLVADVLTGDDYVKGRALWCSAPLAAQLGGNALAGICVAVLGPSTTILISAGFHLCAVAMVRLGLPNLPAAPSTPDTAVKRNWRSTLAVSWIENIRILRTRSVRVLLLAKWIPPGLVTGAEALIVPYAVRHGYPESAAGILLACLAAGMMVSNLIFGRITDPRLRDKLTASLTLVAGLPLVLLVASPPAVVAGVLLVISGAGLSYDLGLELRFVEAIPADKRGLAFGLRSTGLMTVQGIGPLVAGALALMLPVGVVIALTGAVTAVLGVILVARALAPVTPVTPVATPVTPVSVNSPAGARPSGSCGCAPATQPELDEGEVPRPDRTVV